MMSPEFAKSAGQMKDRARFAKLDTESYPQAGASYGIRGKPLLVRFEGGKGSARQAGAIPADAIVRWVG